MSELIVRELRLRARDGRRTERPGQGVPGPGRRADAPRANPTAVDRLASQLSRRRGHDVEVGRDV